MRISTKLIIMVTVPLAAMTALLGLEIQDHSRAQRDMQMLIDLSTLVSHAEATINQLQIERGLGALYTSSSGSKGRERLIDQFGSTDERTARFEATLARVDKDLETRILALHASDLRQDLAELGGMRQRALDRTVSWQMSVAFYTDLIDHLHDLSHSLMPFVYQDAHLAALYSGFLFLSEAAEAAGQERALVTTMLEQGEINDRDRYLLNQLRGLQAGPLREYQEHVPEDLRAPHEAYLAVPEAGLVAEIRQQLIEGVITIDAERWFEVASTRIASLDVVERAFLEGIVSRSAGLASEERAATARFLAFGGTVLVLGLGLTWAFGRRLSERAAELTRVASAVRRGELSRRADEAGLDELSVLASAFNHMTDKLTSTIRSKDELIASVAHELRTPLTAVVGFAEVLQEDTGRLSSSERQDMIRAIAEEGQDLSNIVDDLLTAAKAEARTLAAVHTPLDLFDEANQVVEILRHKIDGKMIQVEGESVRVIGDPARVRQVLRNLVTNAILHGGHRIWVRVERDEGVGRAVVIDDGPGVPPDARRRIFEPYERAHQVPGLTLSMGLGLAVSRQLAIVMGGELTYRYEDGLSSFSLTLPVAADQPGG